MAEYVVNFEIVVWLATSQLIDEISII